MPEPLHTHGDSPTRFVDNREGIPPPFVPTEGDHATFIGTTDAAAFLQPSTVIADRFEIISLIGRGGMGVVYKVQDRLTRQTLALKMMLPSVLAVPGAADRFVREVNTARQLRHDGIAAVYDIHQSGTLLFFTMEFLDGKTLRHLLNERRKLPLEETVRILDQLCRALDHAHCVTIHRDISPENVMLLADGTVKLLDFGVARYLKGSTKHTETGTKIGKAYYMAPEQRTNPIKVDARADIWPLGVMFFEMLSGELPMGYQRLTNLVPGIPQACDNLVEGSVTPLKARYKTVRKFQAQLGRCVQTGVKGARPVSQNSIVVVPMASQTAAKRRAGEVAAFAGIEFVWCPPGKFMMGSPETEVGHADDETLHEVTFTKGFWLGKYQVTMQQWKLLMGTEPWKGRFVLKDPYSPVVHVNWSDCQEYVRKLNQESTGNFDLPSEAQWEYACRAGTKTAYGFGESADELDRYAWNRCNTHDIGIMHAQRVGSKRPNAWGLFDMHGNVWEWCKDWYGDYFAGAATNPVGASLGKIKVLRGGSWYVKPVHCRAAIRGEFAPENKNANIGFRIMRTEV